MWILAIVIIITVTCHVARADQCAPINKSINTLLAQGAICKIEYAKFYLPDSAWNVLNVDQKTLYLRVFAIYYECNGGGAHRSEVYSYYTGRRLAKYGPFGAKFY